MGPTHVAQVDIDFFNSAGIFLNSKKTVKGSVNEGGIRSSYNCGLGQ